MKISLLNGAEKIGMWEHNKRYNQVLNRKSALDLCMKRKIIYNSYGFEYKKKTIL